MYEEDQSNAGASGTGQQLTDVILAMPETTEVPEVLPQGDLFKHSSEQLKQEVTADWILLHGNKNIENIEEAQAVLGDLNGGIGGSKANATYGDLKKLVSTALFRDACRHLASGCGIYGVSYAAAILTAPLVESIPVVGPYATAATYPAAGAIEHVAATIAGKGTMFPKYYNDFTAEQAYEGLSNGLATLPLWYTLAGVVAKATNMDTWGTFVSRAAGGMLANATTIPAAIARNTPGANLERHPWINKEKITENIKDLQQCSLEAVVGYSLDGFKSLQHLPAALKNLGTSSGLVAVAANVPAGAINAFPSIRGVSPEMQPVVSDMVLGLSLFSRSTMLKMLESWTNGREMDQAYSKPDMKEQQAQKKARGR